MFWAAGYRADQVNCSLGAAGGYMTGLATKMMTGARSRVSINLAVPSSINRVVRSGRGMAATRSAIASRMAPAMRPFGSGSSTTTMKSHPWLLPGLGARVAAHSTFCTSSSGTGSGFRWRMARHVPMASKTSMVGRLTVTN